MASKSQKKFARRSTIDPLEIAQFDSLGDKWWDESGPMKLLHRLNPLRLSYIRKMALEHFRLPDRLKSLQTLKIADIGCGGGLLTEPLCRLGARVTGIDAGPENIRVAKAHAKEQGLSIDYRCVTAEKLAREGKTFDVVTALEIVEHVAEVDVFMEACAKLVKPGGLLIMSTLNRTPKSFLLGIVAAEYIMRWLPAGTHNWKKFLKPSELAKHLEPQGFKVTDVRGLIYSPLTRGFSLSAEDLDVNYLLTAVKKKR